LSVFIAGRADGGIISAEKTVLGGAGVGRAAVTGRAAKKGPPSAGSSATGKATAGRIVPVGQNCSPPFLSFLALEIGRARGPSPRGCRRWLNR
jgi:hypothetical protein